MFSVKMMVLGLSIVVVTGCGGGSDDSSEDKLVNVDAGDWNQLRATIELAGMPQTLVDKDVSGDKSASIGITFDIDQNGSVSDGDLRIGISKFQSASSGEISLQSSLNEWNSPGLNHLADLEYVLVGNTVVFTFDKTIAQQLELVGTATPVKIETAITNNNRDTSSDALPNSGFTQVHNIASLTDDKDDYSGNDSAIDILSFKLELTR